MKSLKLVFLLALFALSSAEDFCDRPSNYFTTNEFTYQQPIASYQLALKNLQYPNIIPLLFGNFITHYKKRTGSTGLLTAGNGGKIAVSYSNSNHAELSIVNHQPKAFPVRLRRSKIYAYATKKSKDGCAKLTVKFVVPYTNNPAATRARSIYARAFVKTLLDNARLVLGLGACSTALSSITGICNNPFHPHYGVNFVKQLRPWSGPTLKLYDQLPNPRHVSNELCKLTTQRTARRKINLLMVMFGQFMDHDLILTPSGRSSSRTYSFDLPPGDVRDATMTLTRSDPLPYSPAKCCGEPYSPDKGEFNQFNRITSFVDASTIYGSDHDRAMVLRSFAGGKLITSKTERGEFLPRNSERELPFTVLNANDKTNEQLYASGDVRANENPVLLSLHTIFVREHNRICDLLANELMERYRKSESDEWLYQTARKIVIGELQNIVFHEFVPLMVGDRDDALGDYSGYKSEVDASIDIMFSTAAFRWGHSALRNYVMTRSLNNEEKSYELHHLFFKTEEFDRTNIEDWLLGAMDASASRVDLQHADAVRDFLFSTERGVRDLAAINIARGRDHGLPGYMAARKAYGLTHGLGDIFPRMRSKILGVYASVHHIDPFIGGLAERPFPGAVLGPFFRKVVADQFRRLRDGDRFYYKGVQWGEFVGGLDIVKKIKKGKVRLMDIIQENTRIEGKHVQERNNAFQTT